MRTLRQVLADREARTGKTSWLLGQARVGEAAQHAQTHPWLADFVLDDTGLRTSGGRELNITDAVARVETEGEIRRRVTPARLAALGLVAFAARKEVDSRTVYVTIEGPHVAEVREYSAAKLDHVALRQFVADINSLAQR